MPKQWRKLFMKRGLILISGGTDNHMMLIDLNKTATGKKQKMHW
jgi:glycine/serine hydroxymethyltransferase